MRQTYKSCRCKRQASWGALNDDGDDNQIVSSMIRAAFEWRPSCDLPAGIQILRIQDQHRTMLTHIPIWVMMLQRWEVKVRNTTISLTPDETKLKSPVERWSAAIKFNCYSFDSTTLVKSFQHLHLKIFTAKNKIEDHMIIWSYDHIREASKKNFGESWEFGPRRGVWPNPNFFSKLTKT